MMYVYTVWLMNSKATSLNLANLKNNYNENIINLTGLIRFLLASGNRTSGKVCNYL